MNSHLHKTPLFGALFLATSVAGATRCKDSEGSGASAIPDSAPASSHEAGAEASSPMDSGDASINEDPDAPRVDDAGLAEDVGVCRSGECEPLCTPGATSCDGNSRRICDSTGRWQNSGANCVWSSAVGLDTGLSQSIQLGVDSADNVIAAWTRTSTTIASVRTSRYTAGVGWQPAATISGNNNAGEPRLDVASSGKAIVVWLENETLVEGGSRSNILSRQYDPVNGWDPNPSLIEPNGGFYNTPAGGSVFAPYDVAFVGKNPTALWFRRDDSGAWMAELLPGAGWTSPKALNKQAITAADPRIVGNAAGDAVAVWASPVLVANRYTSGSGWQGPQAINDSFARAVEVAIDSVGNAVAVSWSDFASSPSATYYQRGIGWDPPTLLGDPSATPSSLSLAMGPGGKAIAVWTQENAARQISIWANFYIVGQGFTGASRIQTTNSSRLPRAVMDASGNVTLVWFEAPPGNAPVEMWANRYIEGVGWGNAERVYSSPCFLPFAPTLSVSRLGHVTVVWPGARPANCGYREETLAMRFE